jgi:TRAP-type C4-dicarboxylate transport system permease small subunit
VAYRAGGHIAVAMLTDRLPEGLRACCACVVDLLMLASGDVRGGRARGCAWRHGGRASAELPWLPVGITYCHCPWAAITLLFVLEKICLGLAAPSRGGHVRP